MTPQDWKEVEKRLENFWLPVKLKCDEYELTLRLERINQFKNAILVYVNGLMKVKWMTEDCEERRRFFRPKKQSAYSQKQKAALRKMSKRLRQKAGLPDPDDTYTYYIPYWTSFKALKSHLIKNNSNIQLVREQDGKNEVDGL